MKNWITNSRAREKEFDVKVYVRLAEPFWRAIGLREIEMDINPASRVDDLLVALREQYPSLGIEFDQTPPHIFIGDAEASRDSLLNEDARVHLVWPIAGG
ncbi:MAG: MoaD/ThiS family protein [Chloroflexi bacterium]|nr:MoaD/ThiS family protein [Chloroflexota bacterium]